MTSLLNNYLSGQWQPEAEVVHTLLDPVTGEALARTGGAAKGLQEAFAFARNDGRLALQAMTYAQRAAMLADALKVLQANRDEYYAISLANSGTIKNDSAVDIEGGLFTLGFYAKLGAALGDAKTLTDGAAASLSKDQLFQSQHVLVPIKGLALFINAFNFPSWGLWEKAAPALLSGVPVVIKPATVTAWLTHRMVSDVIAAGVLPKGALSIVCGNSTGLLDALTPFDVLSFTGSADTAATIRAHAAIARDSVRANIEADSLNVTLLGEDATPGTAAFDLFVDNLARDMTIKSGQRCTAPRRALVPKAYMHAVAEAVAGKLAAIRVGNPRNPETSMGALVSRDQFNSVQEGLHRLKSEASVLFDGAAQPLIDADAQSACVAPTLLGVRDADAATEVHRHEVFGPVASLIGYRDADHAIDIAHRGQGSLVASIYSADNSWMANVAEQVAASHGRVHVVSPEVGKTHTGHGNVMPGSIHGGPGRAGGGEELGGLRALNFYHRRSALQAPASVLELLTNHSAPWNV
jgi:3,4-dehydroadipyl-CoA semialdehyde dehydrogenase